MSANAPPSPPMPAANSGIRDNHYCGSVGDYLRPHNYDIHWNPVRIIQRFGRVDRIGSLNPTVQLVNFWPTPNLDQYISLKHRVEARMALVDIAATLEDNLLQRDELQDLIADDLRYRELCVGKTTAYDDLCTLFDQETADGSNTALYDNLLQKAVESIVATFRKRVATGLQTGRGFKIPDRKDQASDTTDFELVTWLVIKKP